MADSTQHRKMVYKHMRRPLLALAYGAPGKDVFNALMNETIDALVEYIEEQCDEAVAEAERNQHG